jgi:hypothetical protein
MKLCHGDGQVKGPNAKALTPHKVAGEFEVWAVQLGVGELLLLKKLRNM